MSRVSWISITVFRLKIYVLCRVLVFLSWFIVMSGPARVPSVSGHRYYIVFIDDFSRVSWVYLLKDRGHVYYVLRTFLAEIKNQFNVTPKILRTDNALEFVQSKIASHCASLGIIHQTSCPHTSQQNGVAERKHRHILDVTRTLMIHMHVPNQL